MSNKVLANSSTVDMTDSGHVVSKLLIVSRMSIVDIKQLTKLMNE